MKTKSHEIGLQMVFEAFFTLLFEHGNTVENIKTD